MDRKEAEAQALRDARYAGELGGVDLARILALSDGIFAFAMTLLVIYVVPPTNLADLGKDYNALNAFVIGFLVLGVWWTSHHRIFLHIQRWDRYLIWTNLVLLMSIAVQPFFIDVWIQFPSTTVAGVAYAACEAFTAGLFALVWIQASWKRRLLAPDLSEATIHGTMQRVLVSPLVFLGAMVVAFFAPKFTIDLFALLLPAQLFVGRVSRHRVADDPPALPGAGE